jgi:hypothetical protein
MRMKNRLVESRLAKTGTNLYFTPPILCGLEKHVALSWNVGTTPVQNIGAYGTEIKDTLFPPLAIDSQQM